MHIIESSSDGDDDDDEKDDYDDDDDDDDVKSNITTYSIGLSFGENLQKKLKLAHFFLSPYQQTNPFTGTALYSWGRVKKHKTICRTLDSFP